MRFRTKERPRGVLRRQDQRRLTLMVAGFGLILLCFTVVRRPEFWGRLFPSEDAPIADTVVADDIAAIAPFDRDLIENPSRLLHDEFLTTGSDPQLSAEAPGTVVAKRVPFDTAEATGDPQAPDLPRIPDDLLKTVKDDVIGVHSAENEAYFAAMKLAQKIEQRTSLSAQRGVYALFMDSPASSRGKAWKVSGQLRRLSEVKGKTNAFGVGMLYDAWITTPDSGDQLVHVVAMKASPEIARLIRLDNTERSVDLMGKDAPEVTFTGYFFKREGYASQSDAGLSLAPMFLAGTLRDVPVPEVTSSRADQLTPYLGWLTFAVCVGIFLIIVNFWASDAAHIQTRAHQITKLPAHATFDDVSAVTISESLGDLQGDGLRTEH